MDSLHLPTSEPENWVEQYAAALHAQRDRAREFFDSHLTRLQRAEDALERHLQRCEEESTAATDGLPERGDEEDYHRRYEMALDDLRDLKAKYAELQRQMDQTRSKTENRADGEPTQNRILDWEAEKRRILDALETDFDQDDRQQRAKRLEIEDVLQTTEKVIAEKDREIEELRRRLEEQNGDAKIEDERSAAMDRVIDGDADIQREREQLEQLQEQWREKLRQAEVELSVERAKLARQHAELEERAKSGVSETPSETNAAEKVAQPACGRWLARLGLVEADWTYRKRR